VGLVGRETTRVRAYGLLFGAMLSLVLEGGITSGKMCVCVQEKKRKRNQFIFYIARCRYGLEQARRQHSFWRIAWQPGVNHQKTDISAGKAPRLLAFQMGLYLTLVKSMQQVLGGHSLP